MSTIEIPICRSTDGPVSEQKTGSMLKNHSIPENFLTLNLPNNLCWRVFTPAPELADESMGIPRFNPDGTAELSGLHLRRHIIREELGKWRFRLTLTNRRQTAVRVVNLIPLKIESDGFETDFPFEQLQVYRLPRQKNDIPGMFHPAVPDLTMRDAAYSGAEAAAGAGINASRFDEQDAVLPCSFQADPGLAITGDEADYAVFIGFAGQTRHLNRIEIATDHNRKSVKHLYAAAEFDGIELAPGNTCATHDLVIEFGRDPAELFLNHARRIGKAYGTRHAPFRNVYSSWNYYGPDIDHETLLDDLRSITALSVGIEAFQIDSGWYDRFGDWNTELEKFPHGMAPIAAGIAKAGLIPGIWTAPFVLEPDSMAAVRYPRLILRGRDGAPCSFKCVRGDCFILDPFAPEAEVYLSGLYRKLRDWGFIYHKLDFLRAVFIHENACFHQRDKNRAQAYRHGLELLRAAIGPDGIINACGGLFEGSAGIADIVRSGADTRGHWEPQKSAVTAYPVRIKQNIFRNFYQHLWSVDPDALQLRRNTEAWRSNERYAHLSNGLFSDEEAFSIVVNQFLGGGIACVSERFAVFDPDRLRLLQCLMPHTAPPGRSFGKMRGYLPECFASRFDAHETLPPWVMVSLCNWNSDAAGTIGFSLDQVPGLPEADFYAAFEFHTQCFIGVFRRNAAISLDIPGHGCRLVRLTPLREPGRYVVGTDGNLSCGMELSRPDGAGRRIRCRLLDYSGGGNPVSGALAETIAG